MPAAVGVPDTTPVFVLGLDHLQVGRGYATRQRGLAPRSTGLRRLGSWSRCSRRSCSRRASTSTQSESASLPRDGMTPGIPFSVPSSPMLRAYANADPRGATGPGLSRLMKSMRLSASFAEEFSGKTLTPAIGRRRVRSLHPGAIEELFSGVGAIEIDRVAISTPAKYLQGSCPSAIDTQLVLREQRVCVGTSTTILRCGLHGDRNLVSLSEWPEDEIHSFARRDVDPRGPLDGPTSSVSGDRHPREAFGHSRSVTCVGAATACGRSDSDASAWTGLLDSRQGCRVHGVLQLRLRDVDASPVNDEGKENHRHDGEHRNDDRYRAPIAPPPGRNVMRPPIDSHRLSSPSPGRP